MVMFQNATVKVATKTTTKNADGVKIAGYSYDSPVDTFRADVQPNTLTSGQVEMYGINSKNAETKKAFFESSNYIVMGNRCKVEFDNGATKYYEIMPQNRWNGHTEVLLIPVENE